MSLTKYTGVTNTIQSLSDRPNQTDGLTPAQLKTKFDQFAIDSKAYINNTLTAEIDTLDAANVKKTGTQTIDGVKTFSSSPIVPTPTADMQASTKKYVDDVGTVKSNDLNTHKTSSDHDGRYYTESEIDDLLNQKVTQGTNFTGTWQGYSPTATSPGIQAVVDSHTEQLGRNKLALKNVLYNVSSLTTIESALSNMFTNASFYVWPMGNSTTIAYHTDDNGGSTVCGNWIMKTLNMACTASKLNAINGGMNLAMTFDSILTGVTYLRQMIPIVTRMSGKTYTFSADVEVDSSVNVDWYVNVKPDSNDANRVNVVDTADLTLPVGRHRIACTFTIPNIDSLLSSVTDINSLEVALRFWGINKTVNAKVYEMVLTEGEIIKSNSISYPAKDILDVEQWYETGSAQVVGFQSTSGQRRIIAPFRTHKYRTPINTIISDIVGNVGKVSTYDIAGTRTDNVAYAFFTVSQDNIILTMTGTTAAGVSFNYSTNSYYT